MEIGAKIKQIRLDKSMTIKELSERTGLSNGFISNVERDVNSPTISSLQKICQALDIGMGDLFEDEKNASHLVRKSERKVLEQAGDPLIHCEIVPVRNVMLQPSCIDIKPGGEYGKTALRHDGEEICMVLAGSVRFWAGEECYDVGEGDCVYVESQVPHRLVNNGDTTARTFWVTWNGSGDF